MVAIPVITAVALYMGFSIRLGGHFHKVRAKDEFSCHGFTVTLVATHNGHIMKKHSILLGMIQGQVGKTMVVKHYGKKVVVTKPPDMSNIKPSPLQKVQRNIFAEAVAYAKHINNTPELKALYVKKAERSKSVYQYVLKAYLKKGGPL